MKINEINWLIKYYLIILYNLYIYDLSFPLILKFVIYLMIILVLEITILNGKLLTKFLSDSFFKD